MYLFLLKKALPFTLTFVVGTALGGLTWLFGGSEKKAGTVVVTRTYDYGSRCRMRYKLVAESKPLVILFKPDARWPYSRDGKLDSRSAGMVSPVQVSVTFGADGKVSKVEPVGGWVRGECRGTMPGIWDAIEKTARQIQFEPETVNSVPVTVTRDVEIRFISE